MAQAALESSWGERAIGNNLFGIKYRKGDWNYQRVLTTEFADRPETFNRDDIVSMDYIPSINKYKFKVYQKFADYPTPTEAFLAHSRLLLTKRYKHALKWQYSPVRYLVAIWKSGYATDESYGNKMEGMVESIEKRLPPVREAIKALSEIESIPLGRIGKEVPKKIKKLKPMK
jgi:flagellum-specific peptidoglycan hydrolase FlgJ